MKQVNVKKQTENMKYIGLCLVGISIEYDCYLSVSTSHFVGCEESNGGIGEALRECEEASGGSEE